MKLLTSLAGGLASAISVTILHELIRKVDQSAPRLDRLGEQAAAGVTKCLENKASKKPVVARTKAPDEAYKPVLDITV